MASFARSFKSPAAYLSPCRRPGMPGRTLSNSSDVSLASNASAPPAGDDAGDVPLSSAPGTPALTAAADDEDRVLAAKTATSIASPRCTNSRPIAIELPKMKKLNTASVYTPPEPLSARGDLPGGYFPMHEDPKGRVHRPHPFHHYLHPDPAAMQTDRKTAAMTTSMAQASLPVSSYFAPGFHDSPLPLGKYYPSNYEQHQRTNKGQIRTRPPVSDTLSSSVKSDSQLAMHAQEPPRGEAAEAETRRKMQQYQRDMIAQATMALGVSARTASKPSAGASLSGIPLRDAWFTGAAHKPASPRLDPLGSPGPVTPMELESAGGYLEQGMRVHDRLSKETMAPAPGTGYTAHSL